MKEQIKNLTIRLRELDNEESTTAFSKAKIIAQLMGYDKRNFSPYKGARDYLAHELGYKPQSISNLNSLGKRSDLMTLEGKGYTATQAMSLVSLDDVTVKNLIENSHISPQMTVKEIQDVVKSCKPPKEVNKDKEKEKAYKSLHTTVERLNALGVSLDEIIKELKETDI